MLPSDDAGQWAILGVGVLALVWLCLLAFFAFWQAPAAVRTLTRALCFWPVLVAIEVALGVAFMDSPGDGWVLPASFGVLVLFALVAVTASGVRALAALLVPLAPAVP